MDPLPDPMPARNPGALRGLPNILSALRIVLLAPVLYLLADNTQASNAVALAFMLAMVLTDYLDGRIARRYDTVSRLGKLLDPVADKVCVLSVSLTLAFGRGNLPPWFAILLAGKDVLIMLGGAWLAWRSTAIVQADPPGKFTVGAVAVTILLFSQNMNLAGEACAFVSLWMVLHSTLFYYRKFLDLAGAGNRAVLRRAAPAAGLIVTLGLIVSAQTLYFPGGPEPARPGGPQVIAHRGGAELAPENTLAAMKKAIELGADGIECDVRQTADTVPVVLHDAGVDRTTDGTGDVAHFRLDDLKKLDAGSRFSAEFRGERIPTLEETVLFVRGRARLLIEIKEGGAVYPGIERRVVEIIRRHGAGAWCSVVSFSSGVMEATRGLDPGVSLGKIVVGDVPVVPLYVDHGLRAGRVAAACDSVENVCVYFALVTGRLVRAAHARGWTVNAWTVNSPAAMQKLAALGVDGIITDAPDVAMSLFGRRGAALRREARE